MKYFCDTKNSLSTLNIVQRSDSELLQSNLEACEIASPLTLFKKSELL